VHKAHYALMNIECDQATLAELVGSFRFSDAVLRHLVMGRDDAVTDPSPLVKAADDGSRAVLGRSEDNDDGPGRPRGDDGDAASPDGVIT